MNPNDAPVVELPPGVHGARHGRRGDVVTTNSPRIGKTCSCGHPWDEHDGMGDCHHPDKRTATGLCTGHCDRDEDER